MKKLFFALSGVTTLLAISARAGDGKITMPEIDASIGDVLKLFGMPDNFEIEVSDEALDRLQDFIDFMREKIVADSKLTRADIIAAIGYVATQHQKRHGKELVIDLT